MSGLAALGLLREKSIHLGFDHSRHPRGKRFELRMRVRSIGRSRVLAQGAVHLTEAQTLLFQRVDPINDVQMPI